eukprot:scaffold43720_cov30-Tisochrysis_lutea.AAC.1
MYTCLHGLRLNNFLAWSSIDGKSFCAATFGGSDGNAHPSRETSGRTHLGLPRREEERPLASKVLREDGNHSLDGTEDSAVDHDRALRYGLT